MRFFLIQLLLQGFLFAEPNYLSFPSDISWKSMESSHFHIIYREGQKPFARKTLEAAERAHDLLSPIFPEAPPTTSIVLADFSDSLNGYSLNFPYPHFVIFAAPPNSSGELSSLDDWLKSVVLHEYAHTLHLYPATGLWKWMKSIFGTAIVPNGMMPAHLHEGLATLLETRFSKGGRGRSPLFKMMTRKAVADKTWGHQFLPSDLLDGSYSFWPHGTSPYYFGFYFYEHLWEKKGARGIYDLTLSASSNWPYLISIPYQQIFDQSLSDIWSELAIKQEKLNEAELHELKKEPVSELSYLTQTKFTKKELALSSSQTRAAFLSSRPDKDGQLEIIEVPSGKLLSEYSLKFSESGGFCWKEDKQDVFVVSIPHQENFYSRNQLSFFKAADNELKTLRTLEGPLSHVHEFDCSPDLQSLLVYQESAGHGTLTVFEGGSSDFELPLKPKHQWSVPDNTWVSAVSFGKSHFFILREGTESVFYQWAPPSAPEAIGKVAGHAFSLKQTKRGIFVIASPQGRQEVWKLDFAKKNLTKVVGVLGGVNQFVPWNSKYLVSSYENGGYDIAEASALPLRVELPLLKMGSPPPISQSTTDWTEQDYSPAPYLIPRTWIPSALFVPYGFQAGAWIPMFDLSQKHFYDFNFGVDQRNTNEGSQMLPYLSGLYGYRFGKSSSLQSSAYFSPGFLVITRSFFKRWGTSISFSTGLPKTPLQAKVSAILRKIEPSDLGPANQSMGLGLELSWNEFATEGLKASISHQQFLRGLGSKDSYFISLANFETFLKMPGWNSSLWYLGLRQGYTEGTPLYNSFFEGGGELLFSQGRGFFLNRGYLQGSFAARRIFGGNLEFRFPISRVDRGFGFWPLFLMNIRGALVLDTTSYDRGISSSFQKTWLKEFLWSTGFELKTDWKFFYYLPTQVRLGAYRGLSEGGEPFYFTVGMEASL